MGASVVNALSTWLEVEVVSESTLYFQRFERGKAVTELENRGPAPEGRTRGTVVRFQADPEIFKETTVYEYDVLQKRLREQAFLNAGVNIQLTDQRPPEDRPESEQDREIPYANTYCYEGGVSSFVEYINTTKSADVIHPDVIHFAAAAEDGNSTAEIAMQYTDSYQEQILSFANNIHTTDGGTHEDGFKRSLTRVMNDYARKYNILKENDKNLSGEDVREGLTCIISVKLKEAQFEGQTKAKLGNTEMSSLVSSLVYKNMMTYLEENPATARTIFDQGAVRLPRQGSRPESPGPGPPQERPGKHHPARQAGRLPEPRRGGDRNLHRGGRLAGGSAKGGRDRKFQAILPLWGKMLNVEKARLDKVYSNEKLMPVVMALGTGIGEGLDPLQAALRQNHHHGRCRRGRLPHPHPAFNLLLPLYAAPGGGGPCVPGPAPPVPHYQGQAPLLRLL